MWLCRLPVKTRPHRITPLSRTCDPGGARPLQSDLADPLEVLPVLHRFHSVHCFSNELCRTPVSEALDHAVESGRLFGTEGETSAHSCSAHRWQPLITYHKPVTVLVLRK